MKGVKPWSLTPKPRRNTCERGLTLEFNYLEDMYQEVTNHRDFDIETLASNVGGFIGMFLGYSLLQFPQFLDFVLDSV